MISDGDRELRVCPMAPAAGRPIGGRHALLGLGALVAAAGHIVYPALLHLRTRRLSDEVPPVGGTWPPLTVVVPAYREESVIAAKVADVFANAYLGPVEVIVVADDAATAAAAAGSGARVLVTNQRQGKADALNRGVAAAGTEVVVLTDANALLAPGSLAAMARWFSEPSVGAVAGEKIVSGGGESAYWRFESWLKRREARTGATVGLVGELAAVRRSHFRPLPVDLAVDDLWLALDILEGGARIVYEPAARAEEEPSPHWREDWERRTRVVSGVLDVLWRRRRMLRPRQGMVAAQLWGHRLARSSLGPLAHLLLVITAVRARRRSRLARLALAAHVVGGAAAFRTQRRTPQSTLERLVGQALFLQTVALGGSARYLLGDRPALWPKPARPGVHPPAVRS